MEQDPTKTDQKDGWEAPLQSGGYAAMRSGLEKAEHWDPITRRRRVLNAFFTLGDDQRERQLIEGSSEKRTHMHTKGLVEVTSTIESVRLAAPSAANFARKGV